MESMINDMKNVTEGINSETDQSPETTTGKYSHRGEQRAKMNGRHRTRATVRLPD